CPNRNFKFQAEMHHHDGSQLAAYREPAQPDQRIQPDVAGPFMSSGQTKHGANLTNPQRRAKLASARGGTSVLLVALLNPKFAPERAASLCELRVRATSAGHADARH